MRRPTLRGPLALLTILALATGCATPQAGTPPQPATTTPAAATQPPAAPAALATAQAGPGPATLPQSPSTRIVRGSGTFLAPPRALAQTTPAGDITLAFAAADVRDVAKSVLGDILGLGYSVDAAAQSVVTLETAQPIRREDVLPTLEQALRTAGLALIRRDGGYTIVPLAESRRQPALLPADAAGYGTMAVPLRFVGAAALKSVLTPLMAEGALTQADPARNLLLVTGTEAERRSIRDLIAQFDVNWLHGMSFALFTPRRTDAARLADELGQITGTEGSPIRDLVRLVPIERLNAVLAISPQPAYLETLRVWMEELDRAGEAAEKRLFVYRVQNGRAGNLSRVLAAAFGGDPGTDMGGNSSGATDTTGTRAAGNSTKSMSADAGAGQLVADPSRADHGIAGPTAMAGAGTRTIQVAEGRTVSLTADEENNALVIYAAPRDYETVQQALRQLDVVPMQVMIEAVITEVTLNNDLRYGVQWYLRSGNHGFRLSTNDNGALTPTYPGFSYLFDNGRTITGVLDALSSVTETKVLSSPQLLVLNNQTALLQVGDQVPVATASAVSTVGSSPIVNSIDYRDTGVILRVTPRVNDGGLVLLDIAQEVSDVTTTRTSKLDSPTIQQRRIASSVAVQDGQSIALGGLIRDNSDRGKDGVPLLKDIPVLGSLFSSTNDSKSRTELLVLLTPRVVRGSQDASMVTEELRRKLRSLAPLAGS
ncbi:type II secretion system secretin GspD [Oleisolibacter albus]|uniref:type II secretion system secretin GspD n=1 Tax=Oleisolibacter albus TaxID=2171757 RepID=UPI0013901B57|nr:type II secretion system secretin GspD [Oleisolibacter albus]